jgi:hypothetical protein
MFPAMPQSGCRQNGRLDQARPVQSPGLHESAPAQRSGPPGALAEEPLERVARSATVVPDTRSASVTVTGQRSTRRHIGRNRYGDSRLHDFVAGLGSMARPHNPRRRPASRAELQRRGKTSDDTVTLAPTVLRHHGWQPGHGGAWLPARSRQPGAGRPCWHNMHHSDPAVGQRRAVAHRCPAQPGRGEGACNAQDALAHDRAATPEREREQTASPLTR